MSFSLGLLCAILLTFDSTRVIDSAFLVPSGKSVYTVAPQPPGAELKTALQIYQRGGYGRSALSAVNEYLCTHVQSEELTPNLNGVVILIKQLADSRSYSVYSERMASKMRTIADLWRRRRKDTLCTMEGQSAMEELNDELGHHGQLIVTERVKGDCNRIKLVRDYFVDEMRKRCENGGYFYESLSKAYAEVSAPVLEQLNEVVGKFRDYLMGQLGGLSADNCRRDLTSEVERMENFDHEAGQILLDGLKRVQNNKKVKLEFSQTESTSENDERKFLKEFSAFRNDNLLKPCRTYMNKMGDTIKQIRLYASLLGSSSSTGIDFVPMEDESKRLQFYGAWAMYNTCSLVERKLARLSVALLREMNFSIQRSKLDKAKMVSLLKVV